MAVCHDVLIETQGEVCLLPLPGDAANACSRRCGFVSGNAVAINPPGHAEVQPSAGTGGRAESPCYQALVAQAEIELAFHSPETVEAGMHAGVTGWQSMTWKPCLAVAGYAILAGYRGSQSGSQEAGHAVREMERWMVPNKLREQRDAATITRISRERSE